MASNKCMPDTCNMPLPRETILIGTQDETVETV